MKKVITSLFALVFITAMSGSSFKPEPRHIRGWFKRAYSYMFTGPKLLRIAGKNFSQFTGGFKGLLLYGGITRVLMEEVQKRGEDYVKNGFYDLDPIAKIAGLPILRKKTPVRWSGVYGHSSNFSQYNPAIIRWGIANLIPNPDMEVDGIRCKQIYRKVFARFFRILVRSYLLLQKNDSSWKVSQLYLREMKLSGFNALPWLEGRYGHLLTEYKLNNTYSPFQPSMAFGFWIRRDIDGTRKLLWSGLQKFMRLYDKEWMEKQIGE